MKQYSHDYTKPNEADSLLYRATRLIANECYDAATERINEARQLLQEYLAQDNMVPDDDTENGWVRHLEAQAEIEALRETVRHYQNTQRAMNAVSAQVVRHSEEVERERDELKRQNQALRAKVERHGQIDSR